MTFTIDRFSRVKNPYDVLGVTQTAKHAEIKKAYRAKARTTHPDRHPSIEKCTWEKRFLEIQEAYEILGDPQTRQEYNEYLDISKTTAGTKFENFWDKVRRSPDEHDSEIAKKKWYDETKMQNEKIGENLSKEWRLGSKKKRIWIYFVAGFVLTVVFSLVMPTTLPGSGNPIIYNNAKGTQTFDWQAMLENPQSAYCDPPHGADNRYCFYQNVYYIFDSDDGIHWYKWVNSQIVPVDLGNIPTSQTSTNSQAYSNAMGYHFCAGKKGNYLVFENCLQMETSLVNR